MHDLPFNFQQPICTYALRLSDQPPQRTSLSSFFFLSRRIDEDLG